MYEVSIPVNYTLTVMYLHHGRIVIYVEHCKLSNYGRERIRGRFDYITFTGRRLRGTAD